MMPRSRRRRWSKELPAHPQECDALQEALIQHLTDFLLELGDDFAFVGRQRRLRIDDSWFHVDLLFLHRRLRCLLIIDLKVGKFNMPMPARCTCT